LFEAFSADWVTESLREEWSGDVNFIVDGIILWNIGSSLLSSSPLALSITGSFSFLNNTSFDNFNIISDVGWSAEVMIWDHSFTITPHADSVAICFRIVDALSEVILNGGIGECDWVAEI
jgi:hypothetical protein